MNAPHHPLRWRFTFQRGANPTISPCLYLLVILQLQRVQLQFGYITTLGEPACTSSREVPLTFAQLGILSRLLAFQLLVILGLGGAPVTLPLQHVADDHAQQAQQEEDGHQDEGHVVWLGFQRAVLPGGCWLTGWGLEREDRP